MPSETPREFRAAAITMVYNEHYFLPAWCRYYGTQLGYKNLYVIDHGSTDGSTKSDLYNRIILPRHDLDETVRAATVSAFQQSIIGHFDAVIYIDCDEFIIPRPSKFASLRDYLQQWSGGTTQCVGVDIFQHTLDQPPLDMSASILKQRPFGAIRPWSSKPLLSSVPLDWAPGFHTCAQPCTLDQNLWMMHLKLADITHALERLALTRSIRWSDDTIEKKYGISHRVADKALLGFLLHWQGRRRDMSLDDIDLVALLAQRRESDLCRLPEEFLSAL